MFCASLADVFEDRHDLRAPRARLAALIRSTPRLDWLLLTKRPENAARLWADAWADSWNGADSLGFEWAPNIWLGTTVEDQQRAEERIPHLLRVPARVRFLSCEPLIERVNLDPPTCPTCGGHDEVIDDDSAMGFCREHEDEMAFNAWLDPCADEKQAGINWVIIGGESGPKARPFDVAWARELVRQCRDAGVPAFVKQLGAAPIDSWTSWRSWQGAGVHLDEVAGVFGHRVRLRDRAGGDPEEWPEDLRVRELPDVSRSLVRRVQESLPHLTEATIRALPVRW